MTLASGAKELSAPVTAVMGYAEMLMEDAERAERAEAIGGTLQAGPAGTGWRVRASVPVSGGP